MNASTILMIIEIIKLLQAMKSDKEADKVAASRVMGDIIKGSPSEIAAVGVAMQDVDPEFLAEVCDGVGDFVRKILGK